MNEQQKELWERIEDVRPTMMTTLREDGTLRARPMWTQGDSFDGSLWFFTADDAPMAEELERNPHVCLAYSKPDGDLFVSVSGRAAVVHDRAKIDELWNRFAEAWFPEGPSRVSRSGLRARTLVGTKTVRESPDLRCG
jgi:general stress protein 26